MGEQDVSRPQDSGDLRSFTQKLLTDLRALSTLIESGQIESGVRRIGAEQELFLIDSHGRPAFNALDVLEAIGDDHFTTELGRFNVEFNLDPLDLTPDCLGKLERQLGELLETARVGAEAVGSQVIMTGILPSMAKSDLTLENMTPVPRYFALNQAIVDLRGTDFEFRVKGIDELMIRHDSVMFEACNTSFQVHFQVAADEFAKLYNVAQAVTAPVLAAATNSPLLLGKRLWRETRIALFQQSIDTRQTTTHLREQSPRVSFGRRWVDDSALEIFQEDIARLRVLLSTEVEDDPFEAIEAGLPPKLRALSLHNGTVYRWNRPCYGISNGKPHLRIENRVLPSGPTAIDEVANAAFWFGLMRGVSDLYPDITRVMNFEAAKQNFLAAARHGLGAQMSWPERDDVSVRDLILEELLPLARQGLADLSIASDEIDRYMGVLETRVERRRTGSQWLLDSLAGMDDRGSKAERMGALARGTVSRQLTGTPIADWSLAELSEAGGWQSHYSRVQDLMVTELFTVNQDELVDLVACMMDWEHIRHVPVEDNDHRLVGLVTHRTLLRLMAQGRVGPKTPIPVSDVMQTNLVTANPETRTAEAIELMKKHKIGCLPIVKEERLVGIVTERDFMDIAGQLLSHQLRGDG